MTDKHESFSETAIRECRLRFMQSAAAHPQIQLGESLKAKVFEPSSRRWAELGLPVPNVPDLTPEQYRALQVFQQEQDRLIEAWAACHNLHYEWVRRIAIDTLGWEDFPDRPFSTVPGYGPPRFFWKSWYLEHEDERTYQKEITASFRKTLNAYTRVIKRQRREFSWDRGSQSSHYRWAVERVCLDWNWPQIASTNHPRVTWQAVQKAVLPILAQIGITTSTT